MNPALFGRMALLSPFVLPVVAISDTTVGLAKDPSANGLPSNTSFENSTPEFLEFQETPAGTWTSIADQPILDD